MEVFKLIVDEKVKVWKRTYINVEAESLEQAVEMVRKEGLDACDDGIYDTEFLYESEDPLPPSPEDPCTLEILDREWNILYREGDE